MPLLSSGLSFDTVGYDALSVDNFENISFLYNDTSCLTRVKLKLKYLFISAPALLKII